MYSLPQRTQEYECCQLFTPPSLPPYRTANVIAIKMLPPKGMTGKVKYCTNFVSSRCYLHHPDAAGQSEQLCEPRHLPAVQREAAKDPGGPDVCRSARPEGVHPGGGQLAVHCQSLSESVREQTSGPLGILNSPQDSMVFAQERLTVLSLSNKCEEEVSVVTV